MQISNAQEFGRLIRSARTAQKLTQAEVAAACGTGVRFIVDLEKGKPGCELEKSLMVAGMLGVRLSADAPPPGDSV